MAYIGNTNGEVLIVDIVVNDSTTGTWASFISEYLILFDANASESPVKTADELFVFEENNVRIFSQYTLEEKEQNNNEASQNLIKFGTLIKVPKENLAKEILPNAGNLAVDLRDINLGMPKEILDIFQNKDYVPFQQISEDDKQGATFLGNAYRINNNINVWCYCKALGKDGQAGVMVNLTPFIDTISTNVVESGGSFVMSLAALTCEYDEEQGWIMTKGVYNEYAYRDKISMLARDSSLYQKDGEFKQKKFFFHHIVQPNDLIFIQFETLKNEEKVRNFDPQFVSSLNNFYPTQSPAGRFYDMIGLVDVCTKKYSPENTEVTIEIQGRDLMKMIIDDGCYIYPLDYARGFDPNSGQAINRVLGKELYFFKSFVDVTVGYLANFVLNLLSNISVIKDDQLFAGWGDRRSYRYDIIQQSNEVLSKNPTMSDKETLSAQGTANKGQITKDDQILKKPAEGLWQIVKLAIDPNVTKLRLVDTSITDYQGSLLNYMNKICQKPFCEFRGDTIGDQYYFTIFKPPYTQDAFLEAFDKQGQIEIQEDQIVEEDLFFDDSDIYSWYRIRPSGSFIDKSVGDYIASELTVWFEELAELFGAKAYDVSTIYGQIYNTGTSKQEELVTQFKRDLIYLIETTIYLPFTRKGVITICPPDRRIKRGMVIRHKGTDEIFYVDGVTNTASVGNSSVERLTTITVSRGMVEQFARNRTTPSSQRNINDVYDINVMSYFNLVNFNLDLAKDTSKTSASNFKINKDVLAFFLKKKQFIDKYTIGNKDFPNQVQQQGG